MLFLPLLSKFIKLKSQRRTRLEGFNPWELVLAEDALGVIELLRLDWCLMDASRTSPTQSSFRTSPSSAVVFVSASILSIIPLYKVRRTQHEHTNNKTSTKMSSLNILCAVCVCMHWLFRNWYGSWYYPASKFWLYSPKGLDFRFRLLILSY